MTHVYLATWSLFQITIFGTLSVVPTEYPKYAQGAQNGYVGSSKKSLRQNHEAYGYGRASVCYVNA